MHFPKFHIFLTLVSFYKAMHSSIVGSKPFSPTCAAGSNIAVAFKAILVEKNSTSTVDLVPALSYCTHYECDIRSWHEEMATVLHQAYKNPIIT